MNIDAVMKTAREICLSYLTADPDLNIPEKQLEEILSISDLARYQAHRDQLIRGIKQNGGQQELPPDAQRYWDLAKSAIQSGRQAKSDKARKEATRKAERASEAFSVLEPHEQACFRAPTEFEELTRYGNKVEYILPLPHREAFATSRARAINYAQRCAIDDALLPSSPLNICTTLDTAKKILRKHCD